jgi:2,4-dienoyl-CoA reductase-like NADH-dependent reductase (Old Yellow Enzyme family)/thioredoxin reductase
MNQFEHIFKSIRIGQITLKNRIEFPPVGPHLGTSDGYVSRELIEWGRQYAKGGAAIVTLGDSSILEPSGPARASYAIHVGNSKCINPLNRFAETIQRYGAKASIQLNYHNSATPTEMKTDEIHVIIENFALAAYRCWQAGMDMIMVHGAHGHVLSQFVSRKTNSRTDAYGGSLENRARLAVSILDAIRNKVGDKLAIEYRISADEMVPGGPSVEDQLEFAALIQDKIDLIHVSVANLYAPETLPMMNQPAYFPRGLNLKYAELFKNRLKIPVATIGSYNMEMAEQIIAENKADVVAVARTLIADPECVNKAHSGRAANIRPCIRCNNCINRSHELFLSTRCSVNPVISREAEIFTFPQPVKYRKVLVVGGGPAGMEAARTAAARGHKVILLEKEGKLGGTLIMAAAAPFKVDMQQYLDWAARTTMQTPNLTVKLSTPATREIIKTENPDVLILAVGSVPIVTRIPGIHNNNIVWAGDVELGKVLVGERVVVAGAGLTGSETALHLAQQGKRVTLIDMLPIEQIKTGASVINTMVLSKMLRDSNVLNRTSLKLKAVTPSGVELTDNDSNRITLACDTVVLALGVEPRWDLIKELQELASELYVVGDCNSQRGNLLNAVSQGFFAALEI